MNKKEKTTFEGLQMILDMPDKLIEDNWEQMEGIISNEETFQQIKEEHTKDLKSKGVRTKKQLLEQYEIFQSTSQDLANAISENSESEIKNKLITLTMKRIGKAFEDLLNSYEFSDATVDIQFLHPDAQIPARADAFAKGADVFAVDDFLIPARSYGNLIPTGLAVNISTGWSLDLRPRSGLSKNTALRISNSPGTIDENYKDEIGVLVDNLGDEDYTIRKGDRFCQLILEPTYIPSFNLVDDVKALGEDRGGGFGHSGD